MLKLRTYVVMWSCGHAVMWSCGHAVMRSCGHAVMWSCGHVSGVPNAESGVSRLKMVARLMVDRRVVLATSLYGLVGLLQVMMNEVECESTHTCMGQVPYHTHTVCKLADMG